MMTTEYEHSCKKCGKKITKDEWDLYEGLCFKCALESSESNESSENSFMESN